MMNALLIREKMVGCTHVSLRNPIRGESNSLAKLAQCGVVVRGKDEEGW
jgi:hypothetical protein